MLLSLTMAPRGGSRRAVAGLVGGKLLRPLYAGGSSNAAYSRNSRPLDQLTSIKKLINGSRMGSVLVILM